jgi:effector-binding domain-containing protein
MAYKLIALLLMCQATHTMAYEKAFESTPPGRTEIKELPAGRLLESSSTESYFSSSNNLFGPLFRYIQQHDIAMTTPVEARINPGVMYFWVSPDQEEKAKKDSADVRVIDVPKRKVASHGASGSYNEKNFNDAKAELMRWLETKTEYEVVGEPFAVYWNGPFTPWFLKRFEVQIEIQVKENNT